MARLGEYGAVCETVWAESKTLKDEKTLLWAMLKRLRLRPGSGLLEELRENDLIEVYFLPDYEQVFRNLLFYEVCSYTIDDLLSRPWWMLYKRQDGIAEGIDRDVQEMVRTRKLFRPTTPRHTVEETESVGRFRSEVELRLLAPLFDEHNALAAMVSCFRMHHVDGFRHGVWKRIWEPRRPHRVD